jgi:glycosyltransferase involved in cell wall biosynthesis
MTIGQACKSEVLNSKPHGQARVLVGIVTRNRAAILPRAIESALSQSYAHLRVTVLDDGSDDKTWQLQSLYPAVQWIRWEGSRGYLEARNYLMRSTDADFYISLDDDAWFIRGDEICLAVQYMEANPIVGAAAFDILSPDRPVPVARSIPNPTHLFIGCGHIVRISAVRDCGFYVPSPGLYGSEEMDLSIRLLDRNWGIHYLPGVHVWHDKTTVARDLAAQYRSSVCNDFAFALRRCPFLLLIGIVPVKLMNHLRFSAGKHLLNPFFQGLRLFLSCALSLWHSRKPVRTRTFLHFLRLSHQSR